MTLLKVVELHYSEDEHRYYLVDKDTGDEMDLVGGVDFRAMQSLKDREIAKWMQICKELEEALDGCLSRQEVADANK